MPERQGLLKTIMSYLDRNRLGELLVVRNHLSPMELKSALALKKTDCRPLGQILVEQGYVTQNQIRRIIAMQMALRCTAATLTLLISVVTFNPRPAGAESLQGGQVVLASASIGGVASYPELFGTGEKRSSDLSAFTKWSAMFDRYDRDSRNGTAADTIAKWQASLETMRGLPLDQMVDRVNDMANKVKYISDNKNWGRSDYWSTPAEFFTRGGDCEDFAITKYISLRTLGVPDSRMRIAIVKDLEKNIPHAILIVYGDNSTYVLDNQIKTVRSANSIGHYKPIFSINKSAWWLHTQSRNTMVASAAGQ